MPKRKDTEALNKEIGFTPYQPTRPAELALAFNPSEPGYIFYARLQKTMPGISVATIAALCGANKGTMNNWVHSGQEVAEARRMEWADNWNRCIPLLIDMHQRGVRPGQSKEVLSYLAMCYRDGWPTADRMDWAKTWEDELTELEADPRYRLVEYFDTVLRVEIEDYLNPHDIPGDLCLEIVEDELTLEEIVTRVSP